MAEATTTDVVAGPLLALGEFIAQLQADDLSEITHARASAVVLDTLGTALGGAQTPLGQRIASFAQASYPGHQASLIGGTRKLTVEGAAFANAATAKILGMDDSNREYGHVAAQVVPAALAVAEAQQRNGHRLVGALVAGYEVFGRVGRLVRKHHRQTGWDIKSTVGTLAAAASAAYCLELDGAGTAEALALAANLASGTEAYVFDAGHSDTKDLLSGFAARNGVFAAQLAAAGFRGPRRMLDGEYGLLQSFGLAWNDQVLEDLGERYELDNLTIKPYAGCRHTHQAVDAVQAAIDGVRIAPELIADVEIRTYALAVTEAFRVNYHPDSRSAAGLSLPVSTAIALTFGNLAPADLDRWDHPEVLALTQRIRTGIDPDIEAAYPHRNGAEARIRLHDGRLLTGRVEWARGEPENPLTEAMLERKFRALAGEKVPETHFSALLDYMHGIRAIDDVAAFMQLVAAGSAAT